jgi:hypothetical protein
MQTFVSRPQRREMAVPRVDFLRSGLKKLADALSESLEDFDPRTAKAAALECAACAQVRAAKE